MVTNAVGLNHKCEGGKLFVDNSVNLAIARASGFELVCDANKGWTRQCTRTTEGRLCNCMLGDVVDERQFCRCLEPNKGAPCSSAVDCTGGGQCNSSASWLEELAVQDSGAADYFRPQKLQDGSTAYQCALPALASWPCLHTPAACWQRFCRSEVEERVGGDSGAGRQAEGDVVVRG